AFAQALREAQPAQRRDVRLATWPGSAAALAGALARIGLPDVRRVEWQAGPELGFGVELPGALHDGAGWHRTWFVDRYPGGDLEPGWLLSLVPANLRVTLSWHAERLPPAWVIDYLQRQLVNMRASQLGRAADAGDPHLTQALPAAEALQQQLIASQENAFFVSLYVTMTTDT